ncbi:hypothetical protein K1719_009012 [Acacia pycnantha]|nr:hypothetical protein K1719_009012 [Acacia pycnantha]
MAARATSSQVLQKKYDVFISFRGSDIRHTFLSHLKKQLQQEEIDVYVDERLERGDKISTALLEAIESSIIALVIFSKDYASSRWCLEELVKIMECKRVNNQIVIPVFYNIDPSHVRHQEGSYGDAFAQHEQKYNHDLMKLWKSVLKNTANLSGHHSSNYFNESDLIDDIVKNVSKKLEDKDITEPKNQLIGFQKDLTTVESFMKVDSEEVRVIGIWGKGGIDTSGQLHYLVEENLSLGPNSKIIITSRDKHVLSSGGVHKIHEMKELCMEESLQLFCWFAFKQDHPKIGYEKLSMQAIEYARGLPLALKVLGSYLNSRDTKLWESALKKLRKHPNPEIYNVLRVSYDGLDILEKKIFLDIAFFLWGKKKELIISVLDACGDLYADCGIDCLINKALITISRDNIVGIHDLLQEMAEEIVREESREHPEKRSRLNDSKEIQEILKNSMGTDAIEGIILKLDESIGSLSLSANAFKNLSSLRILKIQHCDPNGGGQLYFPNGLESLPDKLSYIYWGRYPLASLPMGFCAEKLVEIHMNGSKVAKLWDDVQNLMNLKTIDLSLSFNLVKLPDLSMAQNLEIVKLDHCGSLCSIHPSILSLPKLSYLGLWECCKPKSLYGDKHMKSLKHLRLFDCIRLVEFLLSSEEMRWLDLVSTGIETLKLPIGRFNKLEKLCLGGLSCLTSLKKFSLSEYRGGLICESNLLTLFDVWRSLEELHFTNCVVYEIPDNISAMSLLRTLSLRGCQVEGLPNSIKHLSELKKLDLGHCKQLRSLPELPPSITHFYVDGCTSLETIDFKVMRTIYNSYSGEVKVCYPGSTIPKGFKYSRKAERFISIELAPSSSDHLLGFASCCVLATPTWAFNYEMPWIWRKLQFEDEEIYWEDENFFPDIVDVNGHNVYLCWRIVQPNENASPSKFLWDKLSCSSLIRLSSQR